MSNRTELSNRYGAFYDNVSRENSRRWNELKRGKSDPWRMAKKAYEDASAKENRGADAERKRGLPGYKAKGYDLLKQCIRIKQLSNRQRKPHRIQKSTSSLINSNAESDIAAKKIPIEKPLSTDVVSHGNLFTGFNGIGLNLNLGYLGIGMQRIFDRGRDVDYIYFQYNHKPGVNVCGSLFKVLDFDEENYKGWFVDGGAFFRGLGIDFFTSPEMEEPVCRGWGINLAYPFDSGISVVPQYYDTPSGWMEKVFGINTKRTV